MSIYYNFCYVDLDKVKTPCSGDGQFYLLENQESYKGLSNPILFKTMNNHHVRECFNKVINQTKHGKLIESLKFIFGNMFWAEIRCVENRHIPYHLNYWNLERYNIENNEFGGTLDGYSIHNNDLKTVIEVINETDLEEYFILATQANELNAEKNQLNRIVIKEWIKMYQSAISKGKGGVYDIG